MEEFTKAFTLLFSIGLILIGQNIFRFGFDNQWSQFGMATVLVIIGLGGIGEFVNEKFMGEGEED